MISEREAQDILDTRDLITIGAKADEVRRRLHGSRTTFVRVFEIHVDAPFAPPPVAPTAGEFRIIGRPASLDAAAAVVRNTRRLAGAAPVTGFSLADLLELADARSLAQSCGVLREAGLEVITDVPLDLVDDLEGAVAAARASGLAVTRLIVHALDSASRMSLVNRARDLQKALGGFQAFAPLPRSISVAAPSTGYDDVKQVALARLVAENIPSIQVDWQLYGPKLAQFALTTGADDVDAVAAIDPGILGTRRSPIEEIRGNIRAAGLEPIERNGRFEPIG